MIGKNIKLKVPDGTEKDLKEIRFIHFVFEKPDNKIIRYSEGQISGNYLQMQFKFAEDQNSVFVSEKPPSQPNTALVGSQASYQGKSLSFSVDQSDKGARMKIASTSTEDGSKWDTVYEGIASSASTINILDGVKPDEYKLPEGVVIKEEWGGNDERNSWTTAAMQDPDKQGKWKVVDSQNKNIAAEFKSQQEAQQFIDYLKKHPELKPVNLKSGGSVIIPGEVEVAGGLDQKGFLKIIKDGGQKRVYTEIKVSGDQGDIDGIRHNILLPDDLLNYEATYEAICNGIESGDRKRGVIKMGSHGDEDEKSNLYGWQFWYDGRFLGLEYEGPHMTYKDCSGVNVIKSDMKPIKKGDTFRLKASRQLKGVDQVLLRFWQDRNLDNKWDEIASFIDGPEGKCGGEPPQRKIIHEGQAKVQCTLRLNLMNSDPIKAIVREIEPA